MAPSPLTEIRNLMKKAGITAYIIPSADPHQSEYVPELWRRRAYASGFTGSAGDLVVTKDRAGLWTDSRYYLQAEAQLEGSEIRLFKMGLPGIPSLSDWLVSELKSGECVGVDPMLFSIKAYGSLKKKLEAESISLRSVAKNLVDAVRKESPAPPVHPAVPHPKAYAGASLGEKLEAVRRELKKYGADAMPVTTLDATAWGFNIRGDDVQYNPVVIAYGAVEKDRAFLFIDPRKVDDALRAHLGEDVEIRSYEAFSEYLTDLAETELRVLVDPETVSRWAFEQLRGTCDIVFHRSPIVTLKATKNPVEIAGIERAHVRDGVAMTQFLAWLDSAVYRETVTERSASQKLESFRRLQDRYRGPSFATISAVGPHGAVVHYEADEKSDAPLSPPALYLIDSGGQYLDGTTDITRTVALGPPTEEMKTCFTRVLKGHINLAAASFPRGTAGSRLDTIARKPLWEAGLNYGHGTGHGVGAYLNVHEGPQAISYYRGMDVPLEEGMVVSVEPGYYKEGAWGIRIENLVRVRASETLSGANEPFYCFETLTLCPIDTRLILPSLLCRTEKAFLNNYHRRVRTVLSPLLSGADREWLERATCEIP